MTVGATNKDIYAFSAIEMLMQIIIALAIAHIPFMLSFIDIPILRFINRNIPYMNSPSMYIMIMIYMESRFLMPPAMELLPAL